MFWNAEFVALSTEAVNIGMVILLRRVKVSFKLKYATYGQAFDPFKVKISSAKILLALMLT